MDKEPDIGIFQNNNFSEHDWDNQNSLRAAIRNKEVDVVRRLIDSGTEANGYPSNTPYQRPLHLAVVSRSLEIVRILLEKGANVDAMSHEGETPLMLAARLDNIPVIDLLLSHTTNNSEDGHYNLSHLHIACMRNNVSLVRKFLLMTQGEGINKAVQKNSLCWAGYTPLHFAVQYGCLETVELLLKSGSDITAKDRRKMTPLHLAHLHRHDEIIDLILMEHEYEHRNPTNAQGLSHFHIACTRDNPSIVRHFLRSNADPNQEVKSSPKSEWRPIHFALYYECPEVIKLLLEFKVNPFCPTISKIFNRAFKMRNRAIYDLFTSRKFKFERSSQDDGDMTILLQACIKNDATRIEEMLSNDEICASDLNTPLWTGSTPLHLAVRYNSATVTKLLLDQGTDPMFQDAEGRTSLHLAFEHRYDEVLKIILETLASVSQNPADNSGLTVFHILCSTNKLRVIEDLLSQGVDVNDQVPSNSVRWAGFTPMHFATMFRQHEVVILLLKNHPDVSIKNRLDMNPIDLLIHKLDEYFDEVGIEWKISDILITISSSLSRDSRESVLKSMSPLHALCIKKVSDLAILKQNLILYPDEINKTIDLPNSRKSHNCSALHLAMRRHHFKQATLLMEKGADHWIENNNRETPLESAASEFGLEWNIEDPETLFCLETAIENFKPSHFHIACLLGLTNVVRHVLNKASDPDLKLKFINCLDDDGRTPLQSLLYMNRGRNNELPKRETTNLLLENGADVNARDFELKTALHLTEYPEDFDTARALISYGADVNAQNVYGRTPLRAVFFMSRLGTDNNENLITLLLESGADINIVDEQGQTFLSENIRRRHNRHFEACIVPLLKHVKKLEVIGFPINDLNKQAYNDYLEEFRDSFNEREFARECQKELEKMTSVRVDKYTALYDIIFKTPHQMVFHWKNVGLQEMVESNTLSEQFPIYGYLIRLQLKKGKIREPLLRKSEESFIISRKILPSACLDAIFQYLCDSDLENIILSTREYDQRGREM